MYDIAIVGAGPAGLSAAIYAQRAGKKTVLFEAYTYGGQIINTPKIENYPGIKDISGFDYATGLFDQALSRHLQLRLDETIEKGWVDKVLKAKNIIRRGKESMEQINILGDDGVPMSYHVTFWKSELVDFIILQQDGFDPVDSLCPLERQRYMLDLVLGICERDFNFEDYEKCRDFFKGLINQLRQMNYSEFKSENFFKYLSNVNQFLEENGK